MIQIDELVKSRNSIEFVIPAKAGIQLFQSLGGLDPAFAGVTLQETFYEIIKIAESKDVRFFPPHALSPTPYASFSRSVFI